MKLQSIEQDNSSITGRAGLTLINEMARISGLNQVLEDNPTTKSPIIRDEDILRTLCGLVAQGKTDFDHVRNFSNNSFFKEILELNRVPSAEILRQRFQQMSQVTAFFNYLTKCSQELWNKTGMQPEYTYLQGKKWVRVDTDMSIFDNDDSKKEGANYTYDQRFGFAPIFSHLGGGWLVNAQLRPGNAHSYSSGTLDFIQESLDIASNMVNERLLFVADAGFDAGELIAELINRDDSDFIIKHNLRNESKYKWLEYAKEHGNEVKSYSQKGTSYKVYHGSITREVEGVPVRQVFELTEYTRKKYQKLLTPEIVLFTAWTSLEEPVEQILYAYRQRGTSEQYHAEFKNDLDMERLPSGKFAVNEAFFQLGMLVYNMLRVIGSDVVISKAVGLKKATRRRLKTIQQNLIYLCGRLSKSARQFKLKLSCSSGWFNIFCRIYNRLQLSV